VRLKLNNWNSLSGILKNDALKSIDELPVKASAVEAKFCKDQSCTKKLLLEALFPDKLARDLPFHQVAPPNHQVRLPLHEE
jgi:hypothetical protein